MLRCTEKNLVLSFPHSIHLKRCCIFPMKSNIFFLKVLKQLSQLSLLMSRKYVLINSLHC